jgi:hypothetical protein
MTNKSKDVLYVGVTHNLINRVYQHKNGLADGGTDYIGTNIELPTREKIVGCVKKRWNIEIYH